MWSSVHSQLLVINEQENGFACTFSPKPHFQLPWTPSVSHFAVHQCTPVSSILYCWAACASNEHANGYADLVAYQPCTVPSHIGQQNCLLGVCVEGTLIHLETGYIHRTHFHVLHSDKDPLTVQHIFKACETYQELEYSLGVSHDIHAALQNDSKAVEGAFLFLNESGLFHI